MKSEIRNLKSRGFTLLEVILATSLAALLLAAVGSAISIHLRFLDAGRTQVEEAQLARAVLRRIADDLRGAVQYAPPDAEELMPAMGELSGELEGLTDELKDLAGDLGIDLPSSDASEDEETDRTSDLSESTEPPPIPGLYGNAYELQVDTSRLPRLDEYNGILSSAGGEAVWDIPSDVKTVTYFVGDNRAGRTTVTASDSQQYNGLVRREAGRATTAYAAEHGKLDQMDHGLDLLAPEVAAIEFSYCDGSEWLDEWDTVEKGGLPVAVKIALAIVPAKVRKKQAESAIQRAGLAAAQTDSSQWLVYRLIVHLPAAEPTDDQEASDELEDAESADESEDEDSGRSTGGDFPSADGSSGGSSGGNSSSSGSSSGGSSGGNSQFPDRIPDDVRRQLEELRKRLPTSQGGAQ